MNAKEFLAQINEAPRALTSQEIEFCLKGADAFWVYPNGLPMPDIPHALLVSGEHSDGYVNVGAALKAYPGMCRAFAMSIVILLHELWGKVNVSRVVGADTSSTDLAADVAEIIKVSHIRMIKQEDAEGKKQVWHLDNQPLETDDIILHIEELITTSSSALQVREGIRRRNPECNVHFFPVFITVVDRSDPDNRVVKVEDSIVHSLLRLNIRNYDQSNCPHCAIGSQAIKPKEGDNWLKLTGKLQ